MGGLTKGLANIIPILLSTAGSRCNITDTKQRDLLTNISTNQILTNRVCVTTCLSFSYHRFSLYCSFFAFFSCLYFFFFFCLFCRFYVFTGRGRYRSYLFFFSVFRFFSCSFFGISLVLVVFFFCSFVEILSLSTRDYHATKLLEKRYSWILRDLRLLRSYDRIPPCDHRRSSTSSSNLIDLFLLSVSSTACFIAFAKTSTATQLSSTEFSLARYLLSVFLVTDRFFRKLIRLRMHETDLKTPVVDYYRRVSFVSSHLVHLRSRIVDRLYCTCKKHKHNTICHSGVRTLVIGFLAIPTEP